MLTTPATRPLAIYGAANPECVKLVHAINRSCPAWELVGFIDDSFEKQGTEVLGVPVLGGADHLCRLDLDTVRFYNNVASSTAARQRVSTRMARAGCAFATLIHPSVDTAYCTIGPGTSIGAWVSLGAMTTIGAHGAVRQLTCIGHETRIDDHVFIGPGVMVLGRVTLCEGVYIGAGSTIRDGVTIGAHSTVAAGAVVVKNVPPRTRVGGIPARVLAQNRRPG